VIDIAEILNQPAIHLIAGGIFLYAVLSGLAKLARAVGLLGAKCVSREEKKETEPTKENE
jgi:hypothetical protein